MKLAVRANGCSNIEIEMLKLYKQLLRKKEIVHAYIFLWYLHWNSLIFALKISAHLCNIYDVFKNKM